MKRFLTILLLLILLFLFPSCAKNYRQDLTPYALADYVERELPLTPLRALDDQSNFYGDLLESDVAFALRVAEDGSNLDEFAVFACPDAATAKAFAKKLEHYLATLYQENREWYLSYIPAEVPKLQNAEVKTFGQYVAYAILNEHERNRVFDLLREKLLQ